MSLTLKQAEIMIDTALAEGTQHSFKPLTVVVLDEGGHVKASKRQDGTSFLRTEIALGKAWGALGVGVHSRVLHNMAVDRPAFVNSLVNLSAGKMVPVPGGILIGTVDGKLLGAIGITGDTSDHDEQCALAGIKAAGLVPHGDLPQ